MIVSGSHNKQLKLSFEKKGTIGLDHCVCCFNLLDFAN